MSVPGIVQSKLDGEQVAAQVPLGGEDGLYVTRSRTLVYRADGLLSDESVEEYPHDAERIEISEGRRKSAIELDYGIEGDEQFKVPTSRLYEALHPVLAGVLNAADVTGADETVTQTYQFSELTLVITSERVVKHVGAAVWDEDFEEYHFADVTALDVEEGNVSSQIIVESGGRPQRIKTPSDQTREVRERIERALLEYHGASSYDEFAREHADPDAHAEAEGGADGADDPESDERADPLAGGVDPIEANPPELDDDGAIIDDDAGVTTDERPGDGEAAIAEPASAEESGGASDAAEPSGAGEPAASEDPIADPGAGSAATEADTAPAGTATESTDSNGSRAGAETDAESADADSGPTEADDAPMNAEPAGGFADSGFEPASSELEADDTAAQLEALTEAVERQNELLAEQQETLETLIEELSRGR